MSDKNIAHRIARKYMLRFVYNRQVKIIIQPTFHVIFEIGAIIVEPLNLELAVEEIKQHTLNVLATKIYHMKEVLSRCWCNLQTTSLKVSEDV